MAWTKTRSELATVYHRASARGSAPDPALITTLRRKLRAERAEDYLRRLLAADPPLTPDQRSHLAGVLLGAGGDGNAAT